MIIKPCPPQHARSAKPCPPQYARSVKKMKDSRRIATTIRIELILTDLTNTHNLTLKLYFKIIRVLPSNGLCTVPSNAPHDLSRACIPVHYQSISSTRENTITFTSPRQTEDRTTVNTLLCTHTHTHL